MHSFHLELVLAFIQTGASTCVMQSGPSLVRRLATRSPLSVTFCVRVSALRLLVAGHGK